MAGKKNNSGIIALTVLWTLVILSFLSLSLARKTRTELSLARYAFGQVRAWAMAWSGLVYARQILTQDDLDEESSVADTLHACGVRLESGQTVADVFKKKDLNNGSFLIGYLMDSPDDDQKIFVHGIKDEERKININVLRPQDIRILEFLLTAVGIEEETAKIISASVLDWRDSDDVVTNDSYGAETDYYANLKPSGFCKNAAFDSLQELRLVRGMTQEIFEKVFPYLTIFPKEDIRLKVNLNTAPDVVLRAVAGAFTGNATLAGPEDAISLSKRITDFREGEDGVPFTDDDRPIDFTEVHNRAFGPEKNLFTQMWRYHTQKSNFFCVRSVGMDEGQKTAVVIDAVVDRAAQTIVRWTRR